MFKKRSYIIVLVFILAIVVIRYLPVDISSRLKLIVGSVFVPLFGISSGIQNATETITKSIIPSDLLSSRLKQLQDENQQLKIQLMQLQNVLQENSILRSNLNWAALSQWKLKPARVIAREPSLWWRGVQIDVGSKDGIRPNLPVITAEGLVGRVSEVGLTRSMVVLLGDQKCRVSAIVPEANDCGIIAPSQAGLFNGKYIDLIYLTRGNELKPGQSVYTSGLGGIFPKGIPIGKIVDIRSAEGLYLEARVQLAANLNSLDVVWVIVQ
ncbi:MAG: rod shape-determining protein MreC [Verrucomicrobiia bacterium]